MSTSENKPQKGGKKNLRNVIIALVVIAAGVIGFLKYRDALRYESTDDAQVETDISPISARIPGYIASVHFTDNQEVHKGDTLITIDDRDLRMKVEMAESALENARASLETAIANVESAQTGGKTSQYRVDELQVRLDQATTEFNRYQKLLSDGSATPQQFEKVKTEKESLEKQIETTRQMERESDSRTQTASTQVKVAESVVKLRQTDLDYAKLQLSYAVVTAPFDGIVSKKNAVPGQLIQAGQPVCSIVSDHNLWVIANFKETQIGKLKTGMRVAIQVDAYSGEDITGRIASFASATGSKFSLIPPDNATGNFVKVVQRVPVRIDLDPAAGSYSNLLAGMSANVKVDLNSGKQ